MYTLERLAYCMLGIEFPSSNDKTQSYNGDTHHDNGLFKTQYKKLTHVKCLNFKVRTGHQAQLENFWSLITTPM